MSNSTTDTEKTLVNFRVDTDLKEKWKNYIDETDEYDTLTRLIRTAVTHEISGDDEVEIDVSTALSNDIQGLRDDLERVKKNVRWLRNQEQHSVDISEVAQDVYDELEVLPERNGSPPEDQEATAEQVAASLVIEGEEERSPQTIPVIAERLGIREDECEEAIQFCQDQFLPIAEVDLSNRTHYFRRE